VADDTVCSSSDRGYDFSALSNRPATFNQKEPSDICLSFRFEKKVGHLLLGPVHSLDRRESVAFNRVFDVQQRDLGIEARRHP
jgi:hypothetical protein